MSHLEHVENIAKELRVDEYTGRTSVSLRGMARLAGVSVSGLVTHIMSAQGVHPEPSKLAEKLINQGFQVFTWNETGIPDTAVVHILEYYALEAQKASQTALKTYRAVAAVGARTLFQNLLGYQERTELTQVLSILQTLVNKVDNLEKEVTEFHSLKRRASLHEGLSRLNEAMARDDETKFLPAAPITVAEWLRRCKGVELPGELMSRFATELAMAYSTLNDGKLPEKVKGVNVYSPKDYNLMELTYQQLHRLK